MVETHSQPRPILAGKEIIIAGAGIAGLSFAIALRKQWPYLTASAGPSPEPPKISIYERDAKKTATDREGYSLSIRSDAYSGGMQALHKLSLLDSMLQASLTGANPSSTRGFAIWDAHWHELMKFNSTPSAPSLPAPFMRIARKALRQIMLDAASAEDITIHWGTSCTGATLLPHHGRVRVQLSAHTDADSGAEAAPATTRDCDLLIAADGAHSHIRRALRPHDALRFAGAVSIAGQARFPAADGLPAPVDRDWGTVVGAAGGVSLFVSAVDERSAVWSLSYRAAEPRERLRGPRIDGEELAEALRREALERGRGIGEPFAGLVRASAAETLVVVNARDKEPFGHGGGEGGCEGLVVFIGDSDHAMSPFAGNGANMALMDGWELAQQLCKAGTLGEALRAYDASSMPRSRSAIQMSHRIIAMAHSQGWRLWLHMLFLRIMRFFMFRRQ